MSLTRVNLRNIIKQQLLYKLKDYAGLLNPLFIMQGLALLFSIGGIGGGTRGRIGIDYQYYSADYVIVFTMIWAFIIAIQLTSLDYREQTVPFVRNHLTDHLSNALFLFIVSTIGAVFALLTRYLYMTLVYYLFDFTHVLRAQPSLSVGELLMGLFASILFVLLASGLGYLIGAIVQRSQVFAILIPTFLVGSLLFYTVMIGIPLGETYFYIIFKFYFREKIFFIFLVKMVTTSFLLFLSAYLLLNRSEVQR